MSEPLLFFESEDLDNGVIDRGPSQVSACADGLELVQDDHLNKVTVEANDHNLDGNFTAPILNDIWSVHCDLDGDSDLSSEVEDEVVNAGVGEYMDNDYINWDSIDSQFSL